MTMYRLMRINLDPRHKNTGKKAGPDVYPTYLAVRSGKSVGYTAGLVKEPYI